MPSLHPKKVSERKKFLEEKQIERCTLIRLHIENVDAQFYIDVYLRTVFKF
jgi:hypothetical protein